MPRTRRAIARAVRPGASSWPTVRYHDCLRTTGRERSMSGKKLLSRPNLEQRLAVLVLAKSRDEVLSFGSLEPGGKLARLGDVRMRMLSRINDQHGVLIHEFRVPLVYDRQIDLFSHCEPGSPVRQQIGLLFSSQSHRMGHPRADRHVPRSFRVDRKLLPQRQFQFVIARVIAAADK